MERSLLFTFILITGFPAWAMKETHLVEELSDIRSQVSRVESQLVASLKSGKRTQYQMERLRTLLRLQKKEREIARRRLKRLENFIGELESRKAELNAKISKEKKQVRKFLTQLDKSLRLSPSSITSPESEKRDAPKRKVLAALADRSLKEIEEIKVDLADADHLERTIEDEKRQLAYLFQEIREKEELLRFHKKLQGDILRKRYHARVKSYEKYRQLKTAQTTIESMIKQFNARKELKEIQESRRTATKLVSSDLFLKRQGSLKMPVLDGEIVSRFGPSLDPESKLKVFKKGIEIDAQPNQRVRAVFPGRVAFVGRLPRYGNVTILDHGANYYTLCANMGALIREKGDWVGEGDMIGKTHSNGKPLYFEVRSKNIAVNPLKWLSK